MKNVTIVLGTARKGRQSEKVYTLLSNICAKRDDVEAMLVDVRDHVLVPETVPSWGEGGADAVSTKWKDIVSKTDAFIFILPEYNHGYPGEWKLLVDSIGGGDYIGKHAFIAGVSGGVFAGVRVADHVKPVLVELNLIPHKTALYVGDVKHVIGEDGETTDTALLERASKFIDEVISVA